MNFTADNDLSYTYKHEYIGRIFISKYVTFKHVLALFNSGVDISQARNSSKRTTEMDEHEQNKKPHWLTSQDTVMKNLFKMKV